MPRDSPSSQSAREMWSSLAPFRALNGGVDGLIEVRRAVAFHGSGCDDFVEHAVESFAAEGAAREAKGACHFTALFTLNRREQLLGRGVSQELFFSNEKPNEVRC